MSDVSYVLVTPACNEAATIEITLQSVLAQTLRPREWIIVSNGSTDRTEEIVERYAREHPFIRLLRYEVTGPRNFAAVVYADEAGCKALKTTDYRFIGLLDADVRFKPDYFASLIARFEADPKLGLAGGRVLDVIDGKTPWQRQYLKDISGAAQFFRRECFESLGGLVPIPEGGWDAITCCQARANGYRTQTFPDLIMEHLKPRNVGEGNKLRRKWQMGLRDYAIGNDPVFELLKCGFRFWESPFLVGVLARLCGYAWSALSRRKRCLSPKVVSQVRAEQRARMYPWLRSP
jgi:cellulose synthase/poly-beta-1,6-N-acetylglucosamine synthase-like glycosyltransferase